MTSELFFLDRSWKASQAPAYVCIHPPRLPGGAASHHRALGRALARPGPTEHGALPAPGPEALPAPRPVHAQTKQPPWRHTRGPTNVSLTALHVTCHRGVRLLYGEKRRKKLLWTPHRPPCFHQPSRHTQVQGGFLTAPGTLQKIPSCFFPPASEVARSSSHSPTRVHLPSPTSAPLPRLGPCLECPLSGSLCMKNLSHPSLECCLKVPSARRPLPASTTPSPRSPILRDPPLSEHIFTH